MKKILVARMIGLVSVAFLAFCGAPATSGQAGQADSIGILLSDIHFDPLAEKTTSNAAQVQKLLSDKNTQDTNWTQPADKWDYKKWDDIFQNKAHYTGIPAFGTDTNYPLLTAALTDAHNHSPNGVVIYTGDLMPHDFSSLMITDPDEMQTFRATTIAYSVQKLQSAFAIPVIIALGNNDSVSGDYQLAPNDPTFTLLAKYIKVVSDAKDPAVRADFTYGGYYAIPDPGGSKQDVLVLNTVFWTASRHYTPPADQPDPGQNELVWLAYHLGTARAQSRSVRLVMHIPPGIDSFSSTDSKKGAAVPFWKDTYTNAFLYLIDQYQKGGGKLLVSFAGHAHQDDFRLIPSPDGKNASFAIRISPSITTSNGNNPAYGVFTYNRLSSDIHTVTTYYYPQYTQSPVTVPPPSTWPLEYEFTAEYSDKGKPLPGYNAATLATLAGEIPTQAVMMPQGVHFSDWQKLYNVSAGPPSPPTPSSLPPPSPYTNWPSFSCAQTKITGAAYDACMQPYSPVSPAH